MQHPFYLKQIGSVKSDLLSTLQQYVQGIDYVINRKMWNTRHVGVDSIRFEKGVTTPDIQELMSSDGLHGHDSRFFNFEVIKLDAGGIIYEHSDIPLLTARRCNSLSRVHVNIMGSATYYFRRHQKDPWTPQHMTVGGIYLFNNAAFHEVRNETADTRYNIVLNYEGNLDK